MTRRTNDTRATLSNNLDPERLYETGFYSRTNRSATQEDPPQTIRVDGSEDISRTSLETTADFASRLSTGEISHQPVRKIRRGNIFTIGDSLKYSPTGHKEPSSPEPVDDAASQIKTAGRTEGSFIDVARQFNQTQAERFNNTSDSSYGSSESTENPFTAATPLVDKNSSKDGHLLLPSVKEQKSLSSVGSPAIYNSSAGAEVQKRISKILENNTFNPSENTPFMRNHSRIKADGGTRTGVTRQGELGKYISEAEFILEEDLKLVGAGLMTSATGHGDLSSYTDGDGGINPAILPNLMNLTGWKSIKTGDLRASRTQAGRKIVAPDAGVNTSLLSESPSESGGGNEDAQVSYGALNNSYEYFSGPLPLAMTINTLVGLATLIVSSGTIALLVSAFREDNGIGGGSEMSDIPPIDLQKGAFRMKKSGTSDEIMRLFRIPRLENDFDQCVLSGILAFYGLEEIPSLFSKDIGIADVIDAVSGNLAINVFDKFANIANSAGYYTVITRAASRDLSQIIDSIKGMRGKFRDFGSAATSGVVQLFKIIDSVVESTTYKFIMTMAALGDRVLKSITAVSNSEKSVDRLPEIATNRIKMSRVAKPKEGSPTVKPGGLAWRHSSSPARYILPSSFLEAKRRARAVGLDKGSETGLTPIKDKMMTPNREVAPEKDLQRGHDLGDGTPFDLETALRDSSGSGRLPKLYTRWVEEKLNSEYIPFYFHDIRTNEIISFHAFLQNLNDSFSADYVSTSAYGRIDDIKVYNKTTRTIGIKFALVSTSQEDMNIMYWNINKLVSMLYPQWSRGRSVINGSGPDAQKFIQPFSQIPTASPLVRIRLGDVLTSNYSKFGLMRLFGLGEQDSFNLHDATVTIQPDIDKREVEEEKKQNEKILREAAFKRTDPGASNSEQAQQLQSFGIKDLAGIDIKGGDSQFGFTPGDRVIIDPVASPGEGYFGRDETGRLGKQISDFPKDSPALHLHKYPVPVEVEIIKRIPDGVHSSAQTVPNFASHVNSAADLTAETEKLLADKPGTFYRQMAYLVKVIDGTPAADSLGLTSKKWPGKMRYHRVLHHMIHDLSPSFYENKNKTVKKEPQKRQIPLNDWFDSKNNFIVRSFESTMGRGLAGFITSLNFDWNQSTWEIQPGLRAPKYLEVDLAFSPIHDIPMGLDHEGMMRAVPYNVGETSNIVGQDPLDAGRLAQSIEVLKTTGAAKVASPPSKSKSAIDKARSIVQTVSNPRGVL